MTQTLSFKMHSVKLKENNYAGAAFAGQIAAELKLFSFYE